MNEEAPAKASRRIMVVDDDADGAETLAIVLRSAGHDVRVAGDGPAALEVAMDFRPEVVFLDVGMPGMDGYETARQLRGKPDMDKALLVALTGYGQVTDRQRAEEAGFDHFLVKPAAPRLLHEIALQARPPSEPPRGAPPAD
jgi:CheY-like chemotaxis protein